MVYMLVDLKQKSQVTIPKELMRKLNLNIGDKLEIVEEDGRIVITPVVVIPKDQVWYYTKRWQKMEKEVDEQIENGQIHKAKNKEELLKGLGLEDL